MIERIKSMIYRLENSVIQTGDVINTDDIPVLEFIGYPSKIVNDGAQLIRLLNDVLISMTHND